MGRIPFWRLDARPGVLSVVALFAVLVTECAEGSNREESPALIITPSSAPQGETLVIQLTAEDVQFEECDPFTNESLVFDPEFVTVNRLDVWPNMIRASVTVDFEAATKVLYDTVLYCNSTTVFNGSFRVRERKED